MCGDTDTCLFVCVTANGRSVDVCGDTELGVAAGRPRLRRAPPCLMRAMPDHLRRLAELATGQHGAITAAQARAAGLNPAQLRRRVQSGVLDRAGCHTYRSPFGSSSAVADLAALLLDCGADVLRVRSAPQRRSTGSTASRCGRRSTSRCVRGRNVQRAHHHIHTTVDAPVRRPGDGRRVAGDVASEDADRPRPLRRPEGDSPPPLDSALRDRLTSELHLHRRIVDLRSTRPLRHPQAAGGHRGKRGQSRRPQLARASLPRAVRGRRPAEADDAAGAGRAPTSISSGSTAASPARASSSSCSATAGTARRNS